MHHVQEVAVGLFTERGFDAVSIEQVAEAAGVSPSTIYRYFGTKEGLVIRDEYDEPLLAALNHYLAQSDDLASAFKAALDSIWEAHFVEEEASTRARMRLWLEVPAIRAAAYLFIEERVDQFSLALESSGRWSFAQARIIVSGVAWSLMAALRNWHDAGGDSDWREHVVGLMSWLTRTHAAPGDPPYVPTDDPA